ncbi:DNA-3-methyladenine glycosylase [Rhizobium rhizophilum]|uniref:Putative 3-methyladenine DNA glycosylase n=1 Tax=Rhizobium rhizophilum TaxID=1850373 RepID=A0ABY2QR61_9HYPH|nr:DNA-3-methyladenine glycosylase [Rhizobium rhizophilum]THV12507.1 DNA-3-methyladenine glycosylase [Rhizobium rhizophilum]
MTKQISGRGKHLSTVLNDAFFARPPDIVARELLGSRLLVNGCGGFIVETEAYGPDDEASHSFKGMSKTNAAMFGPPGTVYIYRSYGRHWCLNFVCTRASAVLVRALQPSEGLGLMVSRRSTSDARVLCRGPGNLCQALGVTNELNGLRATLPPFSLDAREDETIVVSGPRIGLSKAKDRPWRFGVLNSAYVSRPFRPAQPDETVRED